jgi:protein-S-isoprenylcysteine O-methyltransferase Ste14
MDKLNLKVPPAVVFLLCLMLIYLAHDYLPDLISLKLPRWVAAIPGVIGVVLGLAGILQFALQSTSVNPHRPENASALVTGGVYRYSRNPMYLGLLLILVAAVLVLGSLTGLPIVLLFIVYMNRFQIKPEEDVMKEKFGDEFLDYKKRVGRWI